MEILAGDYHRLGAHVEDGGVNFAVFSENAARVELCLFDAEGNEVEKVDLPERSGPIWHGFVPGLEAGCRYGYRVHGGYAPDRGQRFNPNKLLLDPYARALDGAFVQSDALYGFDVRAADEDLSFDGRDSAPFVLKCVVLAPSGTVDTGPRLRTPWADSIIYEAHVKGLTKQFEAVDEPLRGTYDALGHPKVIEHLKTLGVTAVELLPIQGILDEGFLADKGLVNYWGYSPISYFVPDSRYAGPSGPEGFRDAVRRLHDAGIEVLMDVVYNHTGEADQRGPTVSFRGLDNAAYYRLQRGRPRYYADDTGCGHTLNTSHPFVTRLVLDSLRYWVEEMGVDGFRFDLATVLGREEKGFEASAGLLDAMIQDPILSGVKLIAEPWDIGPGGYRLGGFPFPFAEWNDRYRDEVRKFWRGDEHGAHGLAARLLGSAEMFDEGGRPAWSSLNLITAHDGFTLADVTAYNEKHNEANGEDNRDGHEGNYSDNCGAEGPTEDPQILARRDRRRRNILTTLFVSQGTPMLLAGDEIANSQGGNNNAYCQDNEIGWIDWANADRDLLAFVQRLTALRKSHPALRQGRFLHGRVRAEDGQPDVIWRSFEGGGVNWRDPGLGIFCLRVRGSAEAADPSLIDDDVFLAFNTANRDRPITMPESPQGRSWIRCLDTSAPTEDERPVRDEESVSAESVVIFALNRDGTTE
ncbi:glycogen debranching protein GlgX [Thalassobaculum sp. OXR-137]|uniref:glycogen debranching protein GlgX n=1 Tax=Thalassobaculum sp. OXR-137 TaxID=3100173 RepID=UPI002AC8CAC0|nr:glycogen debranching protein GlgX [Thalassobaculum sp. OXR-137]WPZ34292.1 glycogen debranching protein GlgX [Thalassobaculum sp. OXR-137]